MIKYLGIRIATFIIAIAVIIIIATIIIVAHIIKDLLKCLKDSLNPEVKLVREYDRLFFEAETRKEISEANKKVEKLSALQEAKKTKKALKDAKWVI